MTVRETGRPPRILDLDALRGLAAAVVVVHHVYKHFMAELAAITAAPLFAMIELIQAQSHRAVLLFFVLSGFAIGLATAHRPPITRPDTRHYLKRRLGRIVPLFYLSLLWTAGFALFYGQGDPSLSVQTLLGNAVFLQTSVSAKGNWIAPFGLNGPYWSLSYEMFFYLLLPLVLGAVHRLGWGGACQPLALIVIGLVAGFASFGLAQVAPSPFSSFLTLWIVWLLGYVAVGLAPTGRNLGFVVAPAVVILSANMILEAMGQRAALLLSMQEGAIIGSLFATVALFPGWLSHSVCLWVRRGFVWLFLRIGEGSYALYLLHYPVILMLMTQLPDTMAPAGQVGVSVVAMLVLALGLCPWLEPRLTAYVRARF